jgi:hypothetical protein
MKSGPVLVKSASKFTESRNMTAYFGVIALCPLKR